MQTHDPPLETQPSYLPPADLGVRMDEEDRQEQLFWVHAIADDDPVLVANAVLDDIVLQLGEPLLPNLDAKSRARIADRLGALARRRLKTRPIDLQEYVRTVGNAVDVIRQTFESAGALELAAAAYAVHHDLIAASDDHGHLSDVCAELRFRCAVTFAAVTPAATPADERADVQADCRALVAGMLQSDATPAALRAEMETWLKTESAPS